MMKIKTENDLAQLEHLNAKIMAFNQDNDIPDKIAFNINLAIEEMVTNIINYGYDNDENDEIIVDIINDKEELKITITDSAKPFNPLEQNDPNLEASLEDRQIGGLGIFFTKKLMDDINYTRENDKNILALRKSLTS